MYRGNEVLRDGVFEVEVNVNVNVYVRVYDN